jgi:geranylgeranyl pyrophosphate synthase
LVAGKKSLPTLYGLSQNGEFARRWTEGHIIDTEVASLAELLESEGARAFAQESANELTDQALQALESANPQGEAGEALRELAHRLLNRKS